MEHQKVALKWLLEQFHDGRGSILADEMGLGKTISAIALIVSLRNSGEKGPILVVCPATVITQWQEELEIWADTVENYVYKSCPDRR
jgi:DNA excision repair protein ERCC-6